MKQKRIQDYDIHIGRYPKGPLNKLTDVPGVKVGHETIQDNGAQTGVTAIFPTDDNVFKQKVIAASHVINGFGKTTGTIQVTELGTIETPILLTNTLNVGVCHEALVEYMLEENEEIGLSTGTVNPIIGECNDMFVNDIRGLHLKKANVRQALNNRQTDFAEGAVGAGTGMKCFSLKGGIGSASRMMDFSFGNYTMGVLVLANYGVLEDFRLNGKLIGPSIKNELDQETNDIENGSIMIIVATDLPVTSRQLKRIIARTSSGLAKTGSYYGNGSGDIAIGFSTANRIPHNHKDLLSIQSIHDDHIDTAFAAVSEATEEAILNALITAEPTLERNGKTLHSLKEFTHLF